MNKTLLELTERVCRDLGSWIEGTTTSTGGSAGISLISSAMADYDEDAFRDKYAYITDSSNSTVAYSFRKIKNNQQPSGTVFPYRAFPAQIASGLSFAIVDFDISEVKESINVAIKDSFPALAVPVIDTTLVTGNILENASFEVWTAATYPDYWAVSTATAAEDTTNVIHGTSSVKLSVAAGYLHLSSNSCARLRDLENKAVAFYCWVKTAADSNARLGIYTKTQSGTEATTYSDYHTGGDEWEKLELENVSIPDDLAVVQIRLCISKTTAAYFDNAYLLTGNEEFTLPDTLTQPVAVYECNSADDFNVTSWYPCDWEIVNKSGTKYIRVYGASGGNKIEIRGLKTHTALSSETSTIDITPEWEKIIVAGAISNLLRSKASNINSQDKGTVLKEADRWERKYETLKALNYTVYWRSQRSKWGSRT